MNRIFFTIYRIIVPKPIRTMIVRKVLRKKIIGYYSSLPASQVNDEVREVLSWLESNPIEIFPYPFRNNYNPEKVEVLHDRVKDMPYVILEGKRLYFKKRWRAGRVARGFSELMREQDPSSPHRYLTDAFNPGENDVIADIGAAEANFSLSAVEKVKKIYIFEYDCEWAEALRITFEPWKDKVEIINKKVADFDDEKHIRFDTFFNSHRDISFLKIDVDGAERHVLRSCEPLLQSGIPLKIALCTYHQADDEKEFTSLLEKHGFTVSPSGGYMIHFYDKQIKAPYLRRGLIRAVRK
jgi:hypothetical protein